MFKGLLKRLWLASTRTSPPPACVGGAVRQEHRRLEACRLRRRRKACILHRPDRVFIHLGNNATTPNVHRRGDYNPRAWPPLSAWLSMHLG